MTAGRPARPATFLDGLCALLLLPRIGEERYHAVECPQCKAPAGRGCVGVNKPETRTTHWMRRRAWKVR